MQLFCAEVDSDYSSQRTLSGRELYEVIESLGLLLLSASPANYNFYLLVFQTLTSQSWN